MSESVVRQESSSATTEGNTPGTTSTTTPHDFWRSFHLFPFRFDDFLCRYWYLFAIAIYLLVLIVDAIIDVHYRIRFEYSYTKFDLTQWPYIVWQVGVVGVVLLFQRWRSRIPATFQFLFNKGNVSWDEQKRFLDRYQQVLLSQKRYLLIAFLFGVPAIGLVISETSTFQFNFLVNDRFFAVWYSIRDIPYNLFPTLLWSYSAGIAGWATIVTARYIRLLTAKYQLTIQPSHPDNCGGLKPFGIFSLSMALPILLAAILVAAFDIDDILRVGSYFRPAANIFLVGFVLPLAYLAFFRPLWNVHQKMVAAKEAYANEFANHIEQFQKKIQASLDKGEVRVAKVAKEEMEIQQTLHPDNIQYPTWPFDRTILLRFYIPQVVTGVSAIVGSIEPVAKFVEALFSNGPPKLP